MGFQAVLWTGTTLDQLRSLISSERQCSRTAVRLPCLSDPLYHLRFPGSPVLHRLFIDEVGNDHLKSADDPSEQYLCLLGVILDFDYSEGPFTDRMNDLKQTTFGTTALTLHRRELLKRTPHPYDLLNDPDIQKTFDEGLFKLLDECEYVALAVMIDKKAHLEKYKWQFNPYHYCLTAMIDRYLNWLRDNNATGDVMVEARDKKPNKKLTEAYRYLYKHGTKASTSSRCVHTPAQVQEGLTSGEIKLKGKEANIAGLQLADLIANPARRHLICHLQKTPMNDGFGKRIARLLVDKKYRRSPWNAKKVDGYGIKLLP